MPKIVSRCLALCACLLLASLASNLAHAQGVKATPSHAVLAATSTEQVRFTALGAVYQLRLEVFAATGEELFDSDFKPGNLLDWNLQDQQGQRLAAGAYRCVVTTKHLSGQTSQKYGELLLQANQVTLQAPSQDAQAIQAANSLPTLPQSDFLTLLGKESLLPLTLLVHDGEQGRVLSGRGGLSFRTGDFFAGKDQEQMRLTADGKLGLGVTDPQAKLDVGGLIRTSEGIVFPDGTVQTTAYVAPGRTLSERAGMQRDAQDRKVEGRVEDGSRAAPTGPRAALATAGRLSKFADAAGNLTDSGVLETLAGGNLVQTFGNTAATPGAFNHVVEIIAASGKTPLTLVGGAGAMEFWKDAANGGFPTKALAFGVAKPATPAVATDDMIFSAFDGANWFERMRLTNGGNLGIGTTAPVGRLNIVGSEGPGRGVQIDNREIKLRGEGDAHYSIFANRVASTLTIEDTSSNFDVGTPGNVLLAITKSNGFGVGNIGINKSNPAFTLDINGTLSVGILGTGGSDHLCRISFNQLALCSSSIRYKTNIATFSHGLGLISALTPVTFDWKSDGKHDLGLVAEDVEKVSPLLVTYNNGQVEGVKYDRIGVVLINAIKEQQAQLEAKETMIRALEARLAVLEERVRQIAGRRGQVQQWQLQKRKQ